MITKPKTGWKFNDPHGQAGIPAEVIPPELVEVLLRAMAYSVWDFKDGSFWDRDEFGRAKGNEFRFKEIFYDGVHGLGPLGSLWRSPKVEEEEEER